MKKYLVILFMLLTCAVNAQVVNTSVWFAPPASEIGVDSASWESEYKDVYYAIAESGRPALDTADLQNYIVKSLIDGGYWARMDLFYLFAQKTNTGAQLMWINPTGSFNLSDGDSISFTPYEGYTGDGIDDYLSTRFIPYTHASNISLNSTSTITYQRTSGINANLVIAGTDGGGGLIKINPKVSSNFAAIINSVTSVVGPAGGSEGSQIAVRRAVNEIENYKNGTSIGSGVHASTTLPKTNALYLLAHNNNGTPAYFYPGQLSLFILMDGLSDSEASAINTIIETYMDAIGAGVQ